MPKTIVHVDDDFEIRTAVKMILEKECYICLSFETIEEAEISIKKKSPDLIILDVMVEEIDSGLIYYQKLQKIRPPIPIIFLTSLGGEIKAYFEMYQKTVEIIEKPVEPEKLLSAVKLKIN